MYYKNDPEQLVIVVEVPYNEELEKEFEANHGRLPLLNGIELRRTYEARGGVVPGAEVVASVAITAFIIWAVQRGADELARVLHERLKRYTETIELNGKEMPLETEEMEAYLGWFRAQI